MNTSRPAAVILLASCLAVGLLIVLISSLSWDHDDGEGPLEPANPKLQTQRNSPQTSSKPSGDTSHAEEAAVGGASTPEVSGEVASKPTDRELVIYTVSTAGGPIEGVCVSVAQWADLGGVTEIRESRLTSSTDGSCRVVLADACRRVFLRILGTRVRRYIDPEGSLTETIALPEGSSCEGRVVALDDSPVVAASVVASQFPSGALQEELVLTDGLGRFRIPYLEHGCWIGASASGSFASGYQEFREQASLEIRIDVGVASISGIVTDDEGVTVESVVTLALLSQSPAREAVTTGPGGEFEQSVPVGRVLLSVESDGFAPYAEILDVSEGESVHRDIELGEGGLVTGVIVGLDPESVSGLTVAARCQEIPYSTWVTTDTFGRFRLSSLPPGNLRILCTGPSGERGIASVLVTSGCAEELEIRLSPGSRIGGWLMEKRTRLPVVGAYVALTAVGPSFADKQGAWTSESGTFEFAGTDPGTEYRLSFYLQPTGSDVLVPMPVLVVTEVRPSVEARDYFVPFAASSIACQLHGQIEVPTEHHDLDVEVTLRGDNGHRLKVQADAHGRFTFFPLVMGQYTVEAQSPTLGYAVLGRVQLTASQPESVLQIHRFSTPGRLTIRVLEVSESSPVVRWDVRVTQAGNEAWSQALRPSDQVNLQPGRYEASVVAVMSDGSVRGNGRGVTVESGTATTLSVSMDSQGLVIDED